MMDPILHISTTRHFKFSKLRPLWKTQLSIWHTLTYINVRTWAKSITMTADMDHLLFCKKALQHSLVQLTYQKKAKKNVRQKVNLTFGISLKAFFPNDFSFSSFVSKVIWSDKNYHSLMCANLPNAKDFLHLPFNCNK